jgi:phosphohistidine swiveling domain-containing protein
MTAVEAITAWEPPVPGAFTRTYRFGEWISEPVTPLFESWLLAAMEERLHQHLLEELGQRVPRPFHVVVHGWYFYSMNWATPGAFARNFPRMLATAIRAPRHIAGILPATVRHSVSLSEREWREEIQPRYRSAVAASETVVETLAVAELPALIDELADLAGDYFTSIAKLTGAAYKLELNLAAFHRSHLRDRVGWSHLPLLAGFEPPAEGARPAIVSLDWWHEPQAQVTRTVDDRVVAARQAAEAASFAALAGSPRRLRTFRSRLAEAQRLIAIRELQTQELTLAWPVLRRAVMRIGEALAADGQLSRPDDIFFLTRTEALGALAGGSAGRGSLATIDVEARRRERVANARLSAPLVIGRLPRMAQRMMSGFATLAGARPSAGAIVSGTPASSGRVVGTVRVIRGLDDFDALLPGEILVAPLTTPAWTVLFERAAAVITDVGSVAAHASVVAREYGIPAIVGTGDATARLRTGTRVVVDGNTGTVEPA